MRRCSRNNGREGGQELLAAPGESATAAWGQVPRVSARVSADEPSLLTAPLELRRGKARGRERPRCAPGRESAVDPQS